MPLFDDAGTITGLQRPNQTNQTGDINAQALAEYSGTVENTIERRSVLKGWVPMRSIVGTTTVTDFAVGSGTLQKVVPGQAPQSNPHDFSKASISVDTVINARTAFPLLEVFQTQYDARKEVGVEHGKDISKFFDQSLFIIAAKAAQMTQSRFAQGSAGKPKGHFGGSIETMASAAAAEDPAMLYAAIRGLFVKMEEKDVIPREDDVMLAFRPKQFYALQDAEQIINGSYVTSDGTKLDNVAIFKAFGCPVVSSNNLPTGVIANHLLSNAANANAYDGDFSGLVGLALSARAILGGETIPLTSDVFYDKTYKTWFVDSHLAFAATPNRAEYAGAIMLA